MSEKILIADDEKKICELLCDFFSAAGFNAITVFDGDSAVNAVKENPDICLAILDIMMPEKDGWQACREIREISSIPIIMLSARSEDFDMLESFEKGADEYVTKPFSPAVLVKRAEALIKRTQRVDITHDTQKNRLTIDRNSYIATLDGKPLELTLKEFELLAFLLENSGQVISRDRLLDRVWGVDYIGDNRTVDSHIARLRTKLGEFGLTRLKTIYGIGYKLEV